MRSLNGRSYRCHESDASAAVRASAAAQAGRRQSPGTRQVPAHHASAAVKSTPARLRSEAPAVAPPNPPQVPVRAVPEPPPVLAPPPAATPVSAERGAVYALEFPTQCPQCATKISTVRVSRLLRTHVSFTSTLPRKGYIIVCPECDGILSAELSGLI